MTREEALAYAISRKVGLESELHRTPCGYGNWAVYSTALDFINAAISALKGPTREQVEKAWKGEWVHKKSPYDYKIFVCKKCEKQISIQGEPLIFCPACGAAQTDEAVEMVMERMAALNRENN